MVGATGVASLGAFLPQAGLDQVFAQRHIPTAAISFFPAGRAVREKRRLSAQRPLALQQRHPSLRMGARRHRRRRHRAGEWRPAARHLLGYADQGCHPLRQLARRRRPARAPAAATARSRITSCPSISPSSGICSSRKPRRGGASYLLPPFSFVAKEHGSVAVGAARRALDELIKLATTTRGTFRSSKLDERQVVHRQIAEADLKIRAARALMHERYEELYQKVQCRRLARRSRHRGHASDLRPRHRCGDRHRHDGLPFFRQHRPAPSACDRPAFARS